MSIPDFQAIMLPFLEGLKSGEERSLQIMLDQLAEYFELTDEELSSEFMESVTEASAHLEKAGLVEKTANGFKVSALGKQVISKRLNSIDTQYLRRFPGYV